jgi:quercetin dioxygenase-like cupin family protein
MPHERNAVGSVFDLSPPSSFEGEVRGISLIATPSLQVSRVIVPTGKSNRLHRTDGDVVIYCVTGNVTVRVENEDCELAAEKLLYLPPHTLHELCAAEDSVLLIVGQTKAASDDLISRTEQQLRTSRTRDIVQVASEESFPASDPPSRSPITSP